MKIAGSCLLVASLMLAYTSSGQDAFPWKEGQHYFRVVPAQPTALPRGKIEVTEVFSYGCIVCNRFLPTMHRLIATLPANVVVDRAHDAMFDAIWKTGELAIIDPRTNRVKVPLPTIEDVAAFYHRTTGVALPEFLSTAASMGIDTRMGQADSLIMAKYHVTGTPSIVVNGRYRLDLASAGGPDQLVDLVKWLVAREGGH